MIGQVVAQTQILSKQTFTPVTSGLLQRCTAKKECDECRKKREGTLQRAAINSSPVPDVPPIVHEVLGLSGEPLDAKTRAFMEERFGHDFSQVKIHTDAKATESARAVHALAYTVGRNIVFGNGQYAPQTGRGKHLLAHELTHTLQQDFANPGSRDIHMDESSEAERNADDIADEALARHSFERIAMYEPMIQRRPAPYIKKITVHLTPPQTADLEWEGTPPYDATGSDHFTVSTGKGYGDPGDPPGTCTRQCCSDPLTQCAPPWNQPGRVGACCTYYGNNYWTGTPREEHNHWKWWTPIQPYYSSRGIALHQHTEVTGQPIGHGCVRMEEPNAKRIYDFSNGRRTNVTIDGRAAPVACEPDRQCGASPGGAQINNGEGDGQMAALSQKAVSGLEGVMS